MYECMYVGMYVCMHVYAYAYILLDCMKICWKRGKGALNSPPWPGTLKKATDMRECAWYMNIYMYDWIESLKNGEICTEFELCCCFAINTARTMKEWQQLRQFCLHIATAYGQFSNSNRTVHYTLEPVGVKPSLVWHEVVVRYLLYHKSKI